MITISNNKGCALTRPTLKEALQEFGEKFGKRGILHACEVVEDSKMPGVFVWTWDSWAVRGTFKELEAIQK